MRKQRSPWTKKQQFIFGIIVIVVTLIASLTAILIVATKPYVDAEKKVIAIAESKADIKTVTEFDIYHGEATYYGLLGKSGQGEKLAVIVSHDSGEVDIYKQSDGISKSVAKKAAKAYGAKDISYVHLGKYGKTPIWEVKSGPSIIWLILSQVRLLKWKDYNEMTKLSNRVLQMEESVTLAASAAC